MSLCVRVVARLDIKPSLGCVKGVRFEGLRRVGDPFELARRYDAQGADELVVLDGTASLYERLVDFNLLGRINEQLYVPLTVGGGVRSYQDFARMIRGGAEKVAINTAALARPELITECAEQFGSQAVVVSVEYRDGAVFCLGGRERQSLGVIDWCQDAVALGAGELLLTSIDRDGVRQGYDLEMLGKLRPRVTVPIVASGGAGHPRHCVEAIEAGASAVALGAALHTGLTIGEVKRYMADEGIEVRR